METGDRILSTARCKLLMSDDYINSTYYSTGVLFMKTDEHRSGAYTLGVRAVEMCLKRIL